MTDKVDFDELSVAHRDRPTVPYPAPPGFLWKAVQEDEDRWRTPAIGRGRCRYCGRRAVATLMRRHYYRSGAKNVPWDYCQRHLYGCWIESGRVIRWNLVAEEPHD